MQRVLLLFAAVVFFFSGTPRVAAQQGSVGFSINMVDRGMVITGFQPGSNGPAQGIEVGDIITAVNRTRFSNLPDFISLFEHAYEQDQQTIGLTIYRPSTGQTSSVDVRYMGVPAPEPTPAPRPPAREAEPARPAVPILDATTHPVSLAPGKFIMVPLPFLCIAEGENVRVETGQPYLHEAIKVIEDEIAKHRQRGAATEEELNKLYAIIGRLKAAQDQEP